MTLIYASPNHDDGNPKTHAFVVGVGRYPYLEGGDQGPPNPRVPGLGQLTSPPISARRFADWLIESLNNPDAPLGTVELLLSPNQPYTLPNGQQKQIEAATFDNILKRYEDFLRRCNLHPDNIVIFYFCGHGLQKEDLALLPEDFGRSQSNPWRHSINFHNTYRGMSTCRAKTQCYFIDACRQVRMETLETSDFGGESLVSNDLLNQKVRSTLTVFATAAGRAAFGDENAVSRFTDALIAALNGDGANRENNGIWVVKTSRLGDPLIQIIEERNKALRNRNEHQHAVPDPRGPGKVIHQLPAPPPVLGTIRCKPEEATARAELFMEMYSRPRRYRRTPPEPGDWIIRDVEPGLYEVRASFTPGTGYHEGKLEEQAVEPPFYEGELEVN